jgi:hypothetical protein
MVDYQFRDDAQLVAVRLALKRFEIVQRAIFGMHIAVISDVIAIVPERRWVEREQPNGCRAEVLDIFKLLGEPAKISRAIGVCIKERAYVDFVDNAALVPKRVLAGSLAVSVRHSHFVNEV